MNNRRVSADIIAREFLLYMLAAVVLCLQLVTNTALGQPRPQEEDRRFKLAQAYEQNGDIVGAATLYNELYGEDKNSRAFYSGLYRTYMAQKRYSELLPVVEERVNRYPKEISLRIDYADILYRNRLVEKADIEWQNAMDMDPLNADTYALIAQSQVDNMAFEKAVQTYKTGRERIRRKNLFVESLARLYGILGKFELSTREYLLMLDESGVNLPLVQSGLITFISHPKGIETAIAVTTEALNRDEGHIPYMELLSWLYIEQGDYEESFTIAKLLDEQRRARGSNIYSFADKALGNQKYDVAVTAYKYFMETFGKGNPLYPSVIYNYVYAVQQQYYALGSPTTEQVRDLVKRYMEVVNDQQGSILAADALMQVALLQANDLRDADDALETLATLRSGYSRFALAIRALLLEGDLHLQIGDLDKARTLYASGASALNMQPSDQRYKDLSQLRLAELLFYQGTFTEAVEAFTAITEDVHSDATNDALQYLFILQENLSKDSVLLARFATGKLALAQKKWSEAIVVMNEVVSGAQGSSLADNAMYIRAHAEEGSGEPATARATLLTLVETYPDGTVADKALFEAAELTERYMTSQEALELYTRILTQFPGSQHAAPARKKIRELRVES